MAHFRHALPTELAAPPALAGMGMTSPLVLAFSVGAHVIGALCLSALPAGELSLRPAESPVAVSLRAPAPGVAPALPAPLPPEPEVAPLERAPAPARPRAAEPAPPAEPALEPTPTPVTAAPPSVDDVFGDPPPAPTALASGSASGSGFAVASGAGGSPGGAPGGTGTAIGAGAGAGHGGAVGDDAGARRRARLAYKRELERLLRARTSYPRAALRERLGGRVELALRIGHDGALLGVRVAESSGYPVLDDAALASARLDRVPAPPAEAGLRESDELVVGLVYVVR